MIRRLAGCLLSLGLTTTALYADTLRIASYNTELSRDGPGLLLRALQRDDDPAVAAVIQVIAKANADILVLQGIDWDYEQRTLSALRERLGQAGALYPYHFSLRPNSGVESGLDLDGDGRLGGPADAQGFGSFSGQGGMAILSRHPLLTSEAQDFSGMLWKDFSDALLPTHPDGSPFPSAQAQAAQRLSSTGHWLVLVELPGGQRLNLLVFQAGPPVFDGPEDRNGRRNHDEIRLTQQILHQSLASAPDTPVVIAGGSNLDPQDGEGRHKVLRQLLADPLLQDPQPASPGGDAAPSQGHKTPDALDTVDWPGVGRLRVDYVLPSASLRVLDAGVFWPESGEEAELVIEASRHRLVWVDLQME